MSGKLGRPVVAMASLLLSACTSPFGISCADVGRYAVHVEIRDAQTGAPAAEGATLVIRDGEYVDSMQGRPGDPLPPVLSAGPERTGTYQVVVRKDGYREWTREGVRVGRGGRCDELQSADLVARLQSL